MTTQKQAERQEYRNHKSGRYSKVKPCEFCGKSAGVDYYSLPNCNETGIGVVVCEKCAADREGVANG